MKKLLVGLFVFGFLFVGSQVHASAPDLIVTDFSWSPEVPHMSDNPVDHLDLNVTIKNIGDASITLPENMYVTLYKGSVGVGGFALGTQVYTLNPGDSQSFDFRTAQSPNVLEQAGTFDLTVKVDGNSPTYSINSIENGLVSESNESNNTLTKKITIKSSSSDLNTCAISSFTVSPREIISGSPVTISWEVTDGCLSTAVSSNNLDTYIGPVSNSGSRVVYPKVDTLYGMITGGSTSMAVRSEDINVKVISGYPVAPSITVLTPNGRDLYEVGQQINVTWDSTGISASSNNIDIILHGYNANGVIVWSKELSSFTLNDGQEKVILPTYLGGVPFGKNFKIAVGTDSTNNPLPVSDFSDSTFTIGKATDVTNGGCSNGEVYSSTSGQKCPGITVPSIKVLSPNGGEVYKEGDIVRVKWTSSNLPADYRINLVFNYLDELKDEYKQSVLITKVQDKGYYDYKLPMFSQYKKTNYPLPGKNYEFTAYLFDSSLFNAPSSNAVAIGSSAHGSNDGFFTINILNTFTPDTSCSAGAIYNSVTGKKCFEKDEVKDTGCIAGQNYSSMTGKPCALGLYKNDNTDVLNPITGSIKRTLKIGVKGDDVKALQAFLNLSADGSFGPKTQAKVMEWQAAHGLTADGAFGRMSREKAGLAQ